MNSLEGGGFSLARENVFISLYFFTGYLRLFSDVDFNEVSCIDINEMNAFPLSPLRFPSSLMNMYTHSLVETQRRRCCTQDYYEAVVSLAGPVMPKRGCSKDFCYVTF